MTKKSQNIQTSLRIPRKKYIFPSGSDKKYSNYIKENFIYKINWILKRGAKHTAIVVLTRSPFFGEIRKRLLPIAKLCLGLTGDGIGIGV